MKKVLFTLLILLSFTSFSQRSTQIIFKRKIGTVNIEMVETSNDNIYESTLIFLSFQNAKYSTITDIGNIMITDSTELNKLISDLNSAYMNMRDRKRGLNISYKHLRYGIDIYDFTTNAYLLDEKGRKYTTLTSSQVKSIINSISSLKMPK